MEQFNDASKWQSMSLASAGTSSIQNQKVEKHRSGIARVTNNVDDIPGAKPSCRSSKYNHQRDPNYNGDIKGARVKTFYPQQRSGGSDPRFQNEIPGTKPNGSVNFCTKRVTNPLEPNYNLASCEVVPFPEVKQLRETLDVGDIDGARPARMHKSEIRDHYNVDDISGAQANWRPTHKQKVHDAPPRDTMKCSDISFDGFRSKRTTDTLNPVYIVNGFEVKDDTKSKPKLSRKEARNSPDFSLLTTDIDGAVSSVAKSKRVNGDLKTRNPNKVSDIPGAIADTVRHGIHSNRKVDPICPDYNTLDGSSSRWRDISPRKGHILASRKAVPTPSQRRSIEQLHDDVSSVRSLS